MTENLRNSQKNKLVLLDAEDHIAFFSNKVDADYHSHNYIQVTLGLEEDFQINIEEKEFLTRGIIVDSNTRHKLQGSKKWQMYLLINPESAFGEAIKSNFLREHEVNIIEYKDINIAIGPDIYDLIEKITSEKYYDLLKRIKELLKVTPNKVNNEIDKRVLDLLAYIESQPLDELTVKELSQIVFLSESRLSHLFKEETGVSLTSYILHVKLKKAFYLIFHGANMTDAAMEAGFNSPSHFSRSVRDKLGMAPSVIVKGSRYLQV
ncbi:AraC family transcriptional regulator [Evansella sp. AB-P1]|uniref:helix-turn-helix transcriptional regulator n=1 Tax=Evansella sp. AB-P1 TaxID=3037653 RepID=UPI0024201F51|nr:AraC family transcriptional regulator [Evansella sp. AB-P1]MDG5788825.1 AraC family transcriptional regulator [Evansella sp. AB-P1]